MGMKRMITTHKPQFPDMLVPAWIYVPTDFLSAFSHRFVYM